MLVEMEKLLRQIRFRTLRALGYFSISDSWGLRPRLYALARSARFELTR